MERLFWFMVVGPISLQVLKSSNFLARLQDMGKKRKLDRFRAWEGLSCHCLQLGRGAVRVCLLGRGWHTEAWEEMWEASRNKDWLPADREQMETALLQLQRTKFGRQPEWTWKWFTSRAFRKEYNLSNTLISAYETPSRWPGCGFWPTELWNYKFV